MTLIVTRESLTTETQHTSPSFIANSGSQVLVGVDDPLPQISWGMQKLRDGKIYGIGVVRDFDDPLPDGESIDIGIAWNAGITPTISFFGLCQGDAIGYLYESASLTGGTSATAVKLNRNSTVASGSAITIGPTVNNVGTLVLKQILIGGTGKRAGGGDIGSSNLILKPLTSYLVRLTNVNSTDHAAEIILEWSE